ncbi:MAG: UDP-N-acetylmuramoyl-L-alanyl-D-glutamate--2,6-diaminopimelate ligase [Bacilli bacterium]|nr:UDP-N-acetylmuramoyl-L-alanyl-D-glutamate--2,6-diaminopimelate ligase [Bacilli bacterium]
MMKLNELFENTDSDVLIKGISLNSKECIDGDLFVCTMGVSADRHDYIDDAIEHGAVACVISHDVGEKSVPLIKVNNTNEEFPKICRKFYGNPQKDLKFVAVTGTDGKTTIAEIVRTLIGEDVCGYIGTNGATCTNFHEHLINTTPDAHLLYKFLDIFRNNGCKYVSMETSSEAFYRNRLTTFDFDVSIYSNIAPEHLNIHKTFDNYKECKKDLFRKTKKDGFCVLNKDDDYFEEFREASNGQVVTYGMNGADMEIVSYKLYVDHTDIVFKYKDKTYEVNSPLLALYNIYNLASALLACTCLGFEMEELVKNIKNIKVEGRMDIILDNPFMVIVDFAHTPHAIEAILKFSKELDHNKIYVVIGSAGGRDQEKRPVIGKICCDYADKTIFTTDDPRDEDPKDICDMMVSDVKTDNYEIIIDREEAVNKVIYNAEEGDIVLLLCKGNEPYQITKGEYIPYDEAEVARKAIDEKFQNM